MTSKVCLIATRVSGTELLTEANCKRSDIISAGEGVLALQFYGPRHDKS